MPVDEQLHLFLVVLVILQDSGVVHGEQLHFSVVVVALFLGFGMPHSE